MTDSENKESKSKVLGLKGGTNTVRQSFSHGRSKSVVVETRKKKLLITKKVPVVGEDEKSSLANKVLDFEKNPQEARDAFTPDIRSTK